MLATRLTEPGAEPLLLADAKTFLRVTGSDDDGLISTLIRTARDRIERETGLALIDQSWRITLDRWPTDARIAIPLRPLKTLDAARVLDANAVPSSVALSLFDVAALAGLIRLKSSPPVPARLQAGIELDLTIGYGPNGIAVPTSLLLAIQQLVAFWFENRGDEALPIAMPQSVLALIAPFRKRRLV
jgi:uncharacterized phiE125 gp8 family phage protein